MTSIIMQMNSVMIVTLAYKKCLCAESYILKNYRGDWVWKAAMGNARNVFSVK